MCDFTVAEVGLHSYIHYYCNVGIRILKKNSAATAVILKTICE